MIILKAIYENMQPNIVKKKIYLEIDDNRNYSVSYSDLLRTKQYETLIEALSVTDFFGTQEKDVYGTLTIEYNGRQKTLNIYSHYNMSYYGIELDDKTGWLAIKGVSKETYNLEQRDYKVAIFDDALNFIRHVELTNVRHIYFMNKEFPVEQIYGVKKEESNDCMICELGFNYEWIATFEYDMKSGEFLELMNIRRL